MGSTAMLIASKADAIAGDACVPEGALFYCVGRKRGWSEWFITVSSRLWQNGAVFLSIALPLLLYYSVAYFLALIGLYWFCQASVEVAACRFPEAPHTVAFRSNELCNVAWLCRFQFDYPVSYSMRRVGVCAVWLYYLAVFSEMVVLYNFL
jgi:hypothetical protein